MRPLFNFTQHNRSHPVIVWTIAASYIIIVIALALMLVSLFVYKASLDMLKGFFLCTIIAIQVAIIIFLRKKLTTWIDYGSFPDSAKDDLTAPRTVAVKISEAAMDALKRKAQEEDMNVEDLLIILSRNYILPGTGYKNFTDMLNGKKPDIPSLDKKQDDDNNNIIITK